MTTRVLRLAQCPPPAVSPRDSVLDAVRVMAKANVGAAAVTDHGKLMGVISERDVMLRIVAAGKDPQKTKVRQVMTRAVKTVSPECEADQALAVMVANHIRHVVLVNESGGVVGIASSRDLFQAQMENLDDTVRSLEAFVGHDGRSG